MKNTFRFCRGAAFRRGSGQPERLFWWLALGVGIVLAGTSASHGQGLTDFRAPNPLEHAYVGLAADLQDPGICRRISAQALHRVRKPTLARSRCFYYLAINTGDLEWCNEVQPIPASVGVMNWLDPERCRFQAERLQQTEKKFPVSFDHELVFHQLGYTEADVPEPFKHDGEVSWDAYYEALVSPDEGSSQAEFRSRLEHLPDFSTSDRAQDQPLYYSSDEEEREIDWVTSRAQRLCIYGRVGADCGEQLARLRPDMQEIVRAQAAQTSANIPPAGMGSVETVRAQGPEISAFRDVSEREKAAYDMAVRFQDADLCRRIASDAIVIGWSLEPGFLTLSLRSACLVAVAAKSQSSAVCDDVLPLERDDLDGYGQTPAFCRRAVEGWEEPVSRVTMKPDWGRVLQGLGYSLADIPEAVAPGGQNEQRWLAFADHLADATTSEHADFIARVRRVRDDAENLNALMFTEAELRRQLYQLSVIRFHCSINRYGDRYLFNGYEIKPPKKFGGPFELVDHNGRRVTEKDFRGQFLLVYFGYTYCPDVCPTSLTAMSEALGLLGDDAKHVQPLFISIDPERDTPELLANYLAYFHPRLVGLTGSAAQVRRAAKNYQAYYFAGDVDGDYVVDHTSWTYLVGPNGHPLTHFDHGAAPETMAEEIARRINHPTQVAKGTDQ